MFPLHDLPALEKDAAILESPWGFLTPEWKGSRSNCFHDAKTTDPLVLYPGWEKEKHYLVRQARHLREMGYNRLQISPVYPLEISSRFFDYMKKDRQFEWIKGSEETGTSGFAPLWGKKEFWEGRFMEILQTSDPPEREILLDIYRSWDRLIDLLLTLKEEKEFEISLVIPTDEYGGGTRICEPRGYLRGYATGSEILSLSMKLLHESYRDTMQEKGGRVAGCPVLPWEIALIDAVGKDQKRLIAEFKSWLDNLEIFSNVKIMPFEDIHHVSQGLAPNMEEMRSIGLPRSYRCDSIPETRKKTVKLPPKTPVSEIISGKRYYVVGDAVGSCDGTSWVDAFNYISQAMAVADSGDEIWVKKGYYAEQVILNKDISLYGSFAGTETALNQRNIGINETMLDGTGKYYSEVLMTKGRIDGFTIKGGKGTERSYKNVFQRFGGCILVDYDAENPVVSQCRITGTETPSSGFAFACLYAEQLLIKDCIVEKNNEPLGREAILLCDSVSAAMKRCIIRDNDGDGLFCDSNNTVILEECEFINNKWGGVWFYKGDVDIKRCIFRNNSWRGMNFIYQSTGLVADCVIEENNTDCSEEPFPKGGGIFIVSDSTPVFYNCLIKKNRVTKNNMNHFGGGVMIDGSSPIFICCIIRENTSFLDLWSDGGGGVYIDNSPLTKFYNTMFINNEGLRGCIFIEYYSNVEIHGCVFSGNESWWAESALICRNDSTVDLSNITSINNTLLTGPFSVYNQSGYGFTYSIMRIDNSILWDQVPEIIVGSGVTCNVSNSCIKGGWPGEGNISENPLLIDEGFTTKTESGEWLWEEGYYMLQSKSLGFPEDSPCIDAGTTETASQDAARPPGLGTERCDMGAFGGPYNEGWKFYLVGPLLNYMMGVSPGYPFDANNDGRIDVADIVDCISYIPPLP